MSSPQGYSGSGAIAQIRAYCDEPSLPVDATVLNFLNRGVEEVVRRIGGIRLWQGYPTVANQTTVTLNDDVLDIVSANFSMGQANSTNTGSASPFATGALVYPMEQLEQKAFMDAAAGFPAVGFGPPQAYFVYQDQGTAPTQTLSVPPQAQLALIAGTSNGLVVEAGVTLVNPNGETTLSAVASITPSTVQNAQVGSPPGQSNATGYNVYAGPVGGPYKKQNTTVIALGTPFTVPSPMLTVTAVPGSNTATGAGTGGAMLMQLYPAAMIGQVNIYYRARPQLWADATGASWTNLDTSAQEAVVIFGTMRTLMARSRGDEVTPWRTEYESMISDLKESVNRRTTPKSGRVRDVTSRSFPSSPFWLSG